MYMFVLDNLCYCYTKNLSDKGYLIYEKASLTH